MYAVSYKRNFGPEQLKELSDMIDLHHREFLTSEGDKRAESLRLLRGYATEFLYQVSHMQKFKIPETEKILSQTVAAVPDFEPREAGLAFENLAGYAHNLLEQPWRPEFYTLKLTSGYFTHNIRTRLHNPQELLIVMGYVSVDDYTMVMPRPADPAVLIAVSRDCFVASQECLILSQVYERVLNEVPESPASLLETYEARKTLMGDTTTIVTYLVHQAHQKQHMLLTEKSRGVHRSHESHQPQTEPYRVANHGPIHAGRLADVPDAGINDLVQENLNLSGSKHKKPVINGYSKSTYSINGTRHQRQPPSPLEVPPSNSRPESSSNSSTSPRSPSSCNSLKELQDVYYNQFLTKSNEAVHSDSSSGITELMEKHKKTVSQVEAVKQSKIRPRYSCPPISVGNDENPGAAALAPIAVPDSFAVEDGSHSDPKPTQYASSSQNHYHSRASLYSSSGFKGLKHHQDLPKSSADRSAPPSLFAAPGMTNGNGTSSSLLGKIKGTLTGKKSDASSQNQGSLKNSRKSMPLVKSKVTSESYPENEGEIKGLAILKLNPSSSVPIDQHQLCKLEQEEENDRLSPIPPEIFYKVNKEEKLSPSTPGNGTLMREESSPKRQQQQFMTPWSCPHCTYKNDMAENICEMCSKSKDFVLVDN